MEPRQQRRIGPTRRSVSGIHVFRPQVGIPYESTLERDFLIRTGFFLNVKNIIPQPVRIPFTTANGARATYTPDFLVVFEAPNRGGAQPERPHLVEVKPQVEWRRHWRVWRRKWRAAIGFAKRRGWTFHIRDESRIRDEALQNIVRLTRYKKMQFAEDETLRVLNIIAAMPRPTRRLLTDANPAGRAGPAADAAHLLHLLATRCLDCDISRPLDGHTELWIPKR